ncbi:MAG: phage holin family protein [Anaerolineae bacterium]|jgi:putative membrane protein
MRERISYRVGALNWKLALLRILVNGVVIALTTWILPGIWVVDNKFGTFLILGAVFGLLNAFVKPIIQFLTLSFIFATYGLVIIVINAIMLLLLTVFLPSFLEIQSVWAALAGGALMGFLGLLLESLLGMTPPIIDDTVAVAEGGQR